MSLLNLSLSTQSPGPLRGSWLKRRPDSDDDDDEEGTSAKLPRYSWYVTLESESPQPTDEDDESVYSVQGKETDYVADTSDTSTHTWVSSSDSSDLSLHVEYEVASLSEGPNPFDNDASSSDVSDIVAMGVLTFCDSDLGLADDSNDSRSSVDSEIGTADYWTCVQCNAKNNNPLFRYCEKCYQIRKNFFPPRPKWRKRRREMKSRKSSPNSSHGPLEQIGMHQELTSADSGLGSSQDSKCSLPLDLNLDAITMPSNGTSPSAPTSPSLSSCSKESGNNTADDGGFSIILQKFDDHTEEGKTSNVEEKNIKNVTEYNNAGSKLSVNTNKNEENADESDSERFGSKDDDLIIEKKNIDAMNNKKLETDNKLCITCTAAPKNGAFVHGAVTHICCCYPCAVKVWSKTKRCPICNRRVTNVLKAFFT